MCSILAEEAKVGPPKRKFIEFENSTLYTNGVAKHTNEYYEHSRYL